MFTSGKVFSSDFNGLTVISTVKSGKAEVASIGRKPVHKLFKRLLQEAGLPPLRIHDLRHSAATTLLSMGIQANVVQEILGHADIRMTLGIYGHVLPSMQRDAMDDMDDFFGGKQ